jgi:hypothetical protein
MSILSSNVPAGSTRLGKQNSRKTVSIIEAFPLAKNQPRSAVDFLDAVKADVETDLKGKSPVALLNYHGILSIIMLLLQALEEGVADLPEVKKRMAQEFSKHNKMEFGLHDKVFSLAFGSTDAMIQDGRGERLDNHVLRRMGSTFETVWNEIEPDLLPVFLLNDVPDKQLVKKGAPRKLGNSMNSKRILEEKLAGIRDIDPATYAKI